MLSDSAESLTSLARRFLQPSNPTHRQYEALRAFFVEGLPSAEAARRGGYTPGSFRVLVHHFRHNPDRPFFLPPAKGPKTAPKRERSRDKVVALRKQNLSIYDISRALRSDGQPLSPVAVSLILKQEGFTRLPRRQDEDRPAATRATAAAVADAEKLDLSPRRFRTRFGGLFLFLPALVPAGLDHILKQAGFPGTK
jgi:hypothetical protein